MRMEDQTDRVNEIIEEMWGKPISVYTRAQAIEDGILIDVTETAKEAGFQCSFCLTKAVWDQYVKVPPKVRMQDEAGRLWDVIAMLMLKVRQNAGRPADILIYKLHVKQNNRPGMGGLVLLKGVFNSEGVTVMLPEES